MTFLGADPCPARMPVRQSVRKIETLVLWPAFAAFCSVLEEKGKPRALQCINLAV